MIWLENHQILSKFLYSMRIWTMSMLEFSRIFEVHQELYRASHPFLGRWWSHGRLTLSSQQTWEEKYHYCTVSRKNRASEMSNCADCPQWHPHAVSHPFPRRVKTRGSCAHIWIRKSQTPELLKFRSTFLLSSLEFNFQITILQIEREGPEVPGQSKNRSQNDRGDSPPGSGSWFINRKENWCINDLGNVDCCLYFKINVWLYMKFLITFVILNYTSSIGIHFLCKS